MTGFTTAQARERLRRYGPNEARARSRTSLAAQLARRFHATRRRAPNHISSLDH